MDQACFFLLTVTVTHYKGGMSIYQPVIYGMETK